MDFVLMLHSHLPWVLNYGRWPHGSDWLCEAAVDTYIPLLDALDCLAADGVSAPVTLGITPVLAAQLSNPAFLTEVEAFFAQRLVACEEAPASLAASGDAALLPLVAFWRGRLTHLRDVLHRADGDLIAAFRRHQDEGRIEITSSCATHGFLPLLGRDESIRLQLFAGLNEHRRLFGRAPTGCWLPECAFRPPGPWHPPGARAKAYRQGTAHHLAAAGYRYFFVDAHLPQAGEYLGVYGEVMRGAANETEVQHAVGRGDADHASAHRRSPYRAYRVSGGPIEALVRDPRSTRQVWSRHEGFPGDPAYLEFHKIRWPGGLKLWRVTGGDVDLGGKVAYDPAAARERARRHAEHFAWILGDIAATHPGDDAIVAPFDTELFGHWWFEGVDFIADLYRSLGSSPVLPATAREHVEAHPAKTTVRLGEGSWGANGDFSMWLNDQTAWTWQRLWPLEEAFWSVARRALSGNAAQRRILAQAARSLLLAQASDWQFVISTGAASDYAERRFAGHCGDAEKLVAALADGAPPDALEEGVRRADEMAVRDDLFPGVLDAVGQALQ
ncbi:MAG TPA: 1,4-alpha-glucan branching protein domain-containing protein [Gemmatimonadales bacterium]|jgi:1,4-alpha-glucan branching enzyme